MAAWQLIDTIDCNKPVLVYPFQRPSFRGELYNIIDGTPPAEEGKSGKVIAHNAKQSPSSTIGLYPEMFGLKWVKVKK